jgi:peptidyl-prolyl cis-trans isomerase C
LSDEHESGVAGQEPVKPVSRRLTGRLAAAILVVGLLAAGSALAVAARGGGRCPPAGAVLEVGDEVVTEAEYQRRIELLGALYGVKPPTEGKRADDFRRDAAKAVAVAAIVEAEVGRRQLQAAEKAARDALERFIAERYPEGGRARFVEALGKEGLSEADVLAEFRRLLETRRLFQEVTKDVEVTDAQVEAAFTKRQAELALPERRRLRHLVVKSEQEARAALDRLQGGETFAAVAGAVSLDAATRSEGGQLGLLTEKELDAPFAQAAFSAAPGQPFGPVKTDLGWHVGLVEEVVPGRSVTLEEARQPLREQIVSEARLAVWRRYLGRRIEDAGVCYADRYRPADPEAPPPDITPGAPAATPPGGG